MRYVCQGLQTASTSTDASIIKRKLGGDFKKHRLLLRLLSAALLSSCLCSAQTRHSTAEALPTAESVMARVAANQDASEAERSHYVYVQHARMSSRKGKTILCEEITDYRFTPSAGETHEQLLKVDGRMLKNKKYVSYDKLLPSDVEKRKNEEEKRKRSKAADPDADKEQNIAKKEDKKKGKNKDKDPVFDPDSDETIDRDLVENMRKNLIQDKSKDGINARLFPLTSKNQANYIFRMIGRERLNSRDVFHIAFRPKDKNDFGWSGDAYIDTTARQPVLVTTAMARKIPFAVRTLLGTNVPGLGFTVTYAPQADGVWFPVTFSTEFKIHVLYFFHRQIFLNAENREFDKTHVTSRILEETTTVEKPNQQ